MDVKNVVVEISTSDKEIPPRHYHHLDTGRPSQVKDTEHPIPPDRGEKPCSATEDLARALDFSALRDDHNSNAGTSRPASRSRFLEALPVNVANARAATGLSRSSEASFRAASTSQTLIAPSNEPEAIDLPSGVNATDCTAPWCP